MNLVAFHMIRSLSIRQVILISCLASGLVPGPLSAADPVATEVPAQVPSVDSTPVAEPTEVDPSITLRGSVWRTKAGIVFLKTPVGLLTLSSKTTLKDLKSSHEVVFWVYERHSAVEIRRRNDGSLVHRYLTGPMTLGPDSSKTLRCWTAEGEQTAHYGTQAEKLSAYHEGDQVTVEVDESQTIIGVHDLQFDVQVSQTPPSGSPAHLLLSGSVSKTKSNFVFLRTPIGVVMVNAKIGVPPVKVGQAMTLHIDNGKVTVELTKAPKPAPPNNTAPAAPTTAPF
jgi:hypothetical protein